MSYVENVMRLFNKLDDLHADHAEWSQETFGTDAERGPVGALRHLSKEALEAAGDPADVVEYADCLLLLMDAMRRGGFRLETVVDAAIAKMKVNRTRSWPTPVDDSPVEHIQEPE